MTKKKREDRIGIDGEQLWSEMLTEWRKWLLAAFLGALAGWTLFIMSPPDFRAQATVVVDQNVEQAWTYFPDRQLFQFIRRETARLVELAWSDEVLREVESISPDVSVEDLRDGVLQLSQPSDGGWHFYADHPLAQHAATLANAWAEAFVSAVAESISTNPEMQAARIALDELVLTDPPANDAELLILTNQITKLAESTKGLSPYVEVYLSQAAAVPSERNPSMASYSLIGAFTGMLAGPLYSLLFARRASKKK